MMVVPPIVQTVWLVALKVLGFLAIPMVVVSAALMIRTLRRETQIKTGPVVLRAITPVAVLAVYSVFLKLQPPWWLVAPLLLGGVALGIATTRTVLVFSHDGAAVSRRSALSIVIWAVTLVLTQALALVVRADIVSFAYATLYFSVGLTAAENGALLLKRAALRSQRAD